MTSRLCFITAAWMTVIGFGAQAGTITPDIIFGSGNSNRGFEVNTVGSLELGLRAKLRYGPTGPNDALGVGIVQAPDGSYIFNLDDSTAPANRAMWNLDWSINSNVDGSGSGLSTYNYLLSFDIDPTTSESLIGFDPLGPSSSYYLGTNATPNGGSTEQAGGAGDFLNNNVAQNSFNYGFAGFALGAGEFEILLQAFDPSDSSLVAQQSIFVVVNPETAVVPLPAGLPLLAGALGLLAFLRRRALA